ncbi:MAG: YceD family protein, partial [Bdellovibrionota bacterium]
LSEDLKQLHFSEQDPWIVAAVQGAEESRLPKLPDYDIDLEVRKSHGVIFLKGKMDLLIGLLCSRCANSFEHHLSSRFQCMFTRERSLGHQEGTNVGVAYSDPTGAAPEDLDIEFLEKDYVELEDVLKEQIYLKIPFQPLCNEECKGICPVCGQDRNTQPCQCHRIKNSALANALKNYRT